MTSAASPTPSHLTLPPTSSRVWRWGILGAGAISTDFCRALHLHVPNASISIIGARDPASALPLSRRYGSGRVGTYGEVCSSAEVDVVYVGTVHPMHHQHAMMALTAGKPVLVEKPFCLNAAEAAEVVQAARQRGLFCMEAMWVRCMPWWDKVEELLSSARLGHIHHVIADFSCRFPPSITRAFDPHAGGGSLLDIGIYPLSLASAVYQHRPPSSVHAVAALTPQGVDASLCVTLQWRKEGGEGGRGGGLAQLFSSVMVDGPRQVHIIGDKGRVMVHDEESDRHWYGSTKLSLLTKGEKGEWIEEKFHFPLLWEGEEGEKGWNGPHRVLLAYEAAEVQRCLEAGKLQSDRMQWDETLHIMRTMDEIRKQIGLVYPTERRG